MLTLIHLSLHLLTCMHEAPEWPLTTACGMLHLDLPSPFDQSGCTPHAPCSLVYMFCHSCGKLISSLLCGSFSIHPDNILSAAWAHKGTARWHTCSTATCHDSRHKQLHCIHAHAPSHRTLQPVIARQAETLLAISAILAGRSTMSSSKPCHMLSGYCHGLAVQHSSAAVSG